MKRNNLIVSSKDDLEFQEIIKDIIENNEFQKLKELYVHRNTSLFLHVYSVSYYCYLLCKKLKLDYKSAARGALLHDFYLYNWKIPHSHKGLHGFVHHKIAYLNAKKYFKLNWIEKNMILTHMFPLTLFTIPLCYESWLLTLVDKYCASLEFFASSEAYEG